MSIFKKTAVVLVSGFLMAGPCVPAWSSVGDDAQSGGLSLSPLTPEAAAKLPPWIKPSDVVGMGPEVATVHKNAAKGTDLAVTDIRERVQALLGEVSRHIRHAESGSFYSPQGEVEYREGVLAFGKGKYADAIEHFRTADKCVTDIPNVIPNETVEVG
jgi:hypothetical protein